MRPKARALLLHLLDNAGRVITTNEISSTIWLKLSSSGDDSVRKTVRELRAALGDSARTPRYLETVHAIDLFHSPMFAGSVERPHRRAFAPLNAGAGIGHGRIATGSFS